MVQVVQLNNGRTVRVALVTRRADATGAAREVLAELTRREEDAAARQLEVGDGTAVRTAAAD